MPYKIYICTDDEPEARWRRRNPDCPNVAAHTLQPVGYLAWHAWADRMSKTHRQLRCPGCDSLTIWEPK